MSEAPKKIWVTENDLYTELGTQKLLGGDIPYIRADIVDELVEALEKGTYESFCNCDGCKRIRDVLHEVKEESHE